LDSYSEIEDLLNDSVDYVERRLRLRKGSLRYSFLQEEASQRRHYRLKSGNTKYVVMAGTDTTENLKFFSLGLVFNNLSLPFPRMYDIDPSMRFVIMDDLGDCRLDKIT
jgi:aminoglycoside/choline kinase family phosphotransferase